MSGPQREDPAVVLLCGGLGLRQRTAEDDVPKPLRTLPDGRPLLLHVLDYYRAFGLARFYFCVGYGAAAVEDLVVAQTQAWHTHSPDPRTRRYASADLELTFVDSGPYAEKSQRLLDCRPHLAEQDFLLGYADVLSDFDLNELVRSHPASAVATVVGTRVRSRFGEFTVGAGGRVESFAEKPMSKSLISAGYFMCSPSVFAHLTGRRDFENEVVPALVRLGKVYAVVHDGLWLPLDTYKDFVDLEHLMTWKGSPWLTPV